MNKLTESWTRIEAAAIDGGAAAIGVCSIEAWHPEIFESWLAEGHAASMNYLERNAEVRRDPLARFPWASSAIVITVHYPAERPAHSARSVAGHIARYALGDDYHTVVDSILRKIEMVVAEESPGAKSWRYVDTGPLSDRALAAAAGLGWIGKNSMLIDPARGSWFFIGTLLTSLENDISVSLVTDRCGTCTQCIDACPTGAILPGRLVASERCISHATIEQRGPIGREMASSLGENLFGCDICQEACPWNGGPAPSHPAFEARPRYAATPVSDLLRMSQRDFSSMFRQSAVKRAKRAGMIRNAVLIGAPVDEDTRLALVEEGDSGIDAAMRLR